MQPRSKSATLHVITSVQPIINLNISIFNFSKYRSLNYFSKLLDPGVFVLFVGDFLSRGELEQRTSHRYDTYLLICTILRTVTAAAPADPSFHDT